MNANHRLSVALCTFNGSRFLPEQLESIASQTRPPDELVVCDDASSDDTAEIVQEFVRNAPFPVRLTVNDGNLGWQKNFEKAISLCQADFLFPADQDDVWLPEKLRKMESVLDSQPGVGLVFCDAEDVDESLQPLGRNYWDGVGFSRKEKRRMASGNGVEVLIRHNVVAGCMMGFRSTFRQRILPVPHSWGHDGWIALLIAALSGIAAIDEPLIKYRHHETQQVGVVRQDLSQKLSTQADFDRIADAYTDLAEKLRSLPDVRRGEQLIQQIEGKSRHLTRRANLSTSLPSRFPVVFAELVSGRYHRYSNGLQSALKDAL